MVLKESSILIKKKSGKDNGSPAWMGKLVLKKLKCEKKMYKSWKKGR